jgi:tRNA(Ile)-lysidine synthase
MVATGHTASDQAETVLHRLLRGTGLEGLRGIAARRQLTDGVELVRPLLNVSRADVLEYLAEIGQAARHDATNDDTTLTRNRIRHELLPLLTRDYNPRVESVLASLAVQAEEAFAEEEQRAAAILRHAERPREGETVVLEGTSLQSVPGRTLREALRIVWRREGWPMGEMGAEHWRGVEAVCRGTVSGRDLPGGVKARRAGPLVRLGR